MAARKQEQDHIDKLEDAIAVLQLLDAERVIKADIWHLKRELDRLKARVNFKRISFDVTKRVSVFPLDTNLSTFRVEEYVGDTLVDSVFVDAQREFEVKEFDCMEAAAEEILSWYVGDESYIHYREVKEDCDE